MMTKEVGEVNDDASAPDVDVGAPDFMASVPEDVRADIEKAGFKDVGSLAKGYAGAQRMIGGSIRLPGEDAGEADVQAFRDKLMTVPGVVQMPEADDKDGWDKFYAKLGRPESADKYEFQRPEMPDGVEYNDEMETSFRGVAHDLGLSQTQAAKLADWFNGSQIEQVNGYIEAGKNAEAALRKEYGAAYDQRVGMVRNYIAQNADENVIAELDTGIGNNPHLIMMLHDLIKGTVEDSALQQMNNTAKTGTEIDAEIAEIMRNPAYTNKTDPAHKSLVDKANRLFAAKAG